MSYPTPFGIKASTEDTIAYHLVGDRGGSPSFDVPEVLTCQLLNLIKYLPKSVFQVTHPTRYYRNKLSSNDTQTVIFGVIFSENFKLFIDHLLKPYFVNIFFWTSADKPSIRIASELSIPHFFVPESKTIETSLIEGGVNPKLIVSTDQILDEIISRLKKRRIFTDKEILQATKNRAANTARFHSEVYSKNTLPFIPVSVNEGQITQLLGAFGMRHWNPIEPNIPAHRPEALSKSFKAVCSYLYTLSCFKNEKMPMAGKLPSCIIAFPSISPALKEARSREPRALSSSEKKIWRLFNRMRILEQETGTYINLVNPSFDGIDVNQAQAAIMSGISALKRYCHFFDILGYLHASFEMAPYLRLPIKGATFSREFNFFKPENFSKTSSPSVINKNINEFGKALSASIPASILNELGNYKGGIVAFSDLPLEWTIINQVPLGFLKDVCRIPESAITNILAHYNRHANIRFTILPHIIKKTLVICGAPQDDEIFKTFKSLQGISPQVEMIACSSLQSLFEAVNKFKPELLILDTHGRYMQNKTGTELQFGNEFLTGDMVIKKLPVVPLVILSTCWGAPLCGCTNTIAHAFFEAGSLAVTSSLVPLNIYKGAVLYHRVLRNLSFASQAPVHETWASFISHTVRTSYFDDCWIRIRQKFAINQDPENYKEIRVKWQSKTMKHDDREKAFQDIHLYISEIVPWLNSDKIHRTLKARSYLPEHLFYSNFGRADLIKFKCWNSKWHEELSIPDQSVESLPDTQTLSAVGDRLNPKKS